MKARILKMPGRDCFHFLKGHCLYEERLNPGYSLEWRCKILNRLEEEFDRFLIQADNFNLDEQTAERIWGERLERFLEKEIRCESYSPGGEPGIIDCIHAYGSQCVPEMPLCSGKCASFKHK